MTDTAAPAVEQTLRIEARPEIVWEFLRHFDLPAVTSGDHDQGWGRQLAVLVAAVDGLS